jgi:rhodanese-related sulfurtransferase
MLSIIKKVFGLGPAVDYSALIAAGAQIVDVRTPDEYKQGHIKNSANIPLQSLSAKLGNIRKDKAVIVCCASGARSANAKSILMSSGFAEVHNGGGWQGLQRNLAGSK